MRITATEAQARDLAAARHDPWRTIVLITAIAGEKFIDRYLAQPHPRPVIQIVVQPQLDNIDLTIDIANKPTSLRSLSTHHIAGRGIVKICRVQRIPEIGPIVIDDEHMIAVGIESTSSWTPGGDIGIVVKPAPDQSTEVKT